MPGLVHVTLADGTKRIGRDLRFVTEPVRPGLLRRKMLTEVCYLTDLNGAETRVGPIREMSWR